MTATKDFSIIIAHRGPALGLWATVQSCEENLSRSQFNYEYCICVNGQQGTKKFPKTDFVDLDTKRVIDFIAKSGKLGHVNFLQRSLSPPSARQMATEHANGKYLFFFDNHCILGHQYFDRAIIDFLKYDADMIHSTTKFHAGDMDAYEYKLTLDTNFWAKSQAVSQFDWKPYRVAAGGHGGFAVKADVWREVGGYWTGFNGYGGEELYFDLKMAMLSKTNYLDPKLIHYHYPGRREYSRHYSDDYYRNMMMCANIIGGEEWLYRVAYSFMTQFPQNNTAPYLLMREAYEASKDHASWLKSIRHRTLEEQLALFKTSDIPC